MAVVAEDNRQALLKTLSGINVAVLGGLTDAIINANATITLLNAAILALAPLAGTAPDALRQATVGLRIGVLAGAIAETHTATTVATLRALVTPYLPGVASTYTASLPQ